MAEEYKSVHTGPDIDAAVTRALPGGGIDQALNAKPNPNLLDNAYFGNPVNQRGQTEYTGAGYGIDCWKMASGVTNAVTVENDGLKVTFNSAAYLVQIIKNPAVFSGKTVTISALCGDIGNGLQIRIRANGSFVCNVSCVTNGVANTTVTLPDNLTAMQFEFGSASTAGYSVKIKAAKMELGTEQTLAHQENGKWVLNEIPNHDEELAKCQRYQFVCKTDMVGVVVFRNSAGGGGGALFTLPSQLRAAPAFTGVMKAGDITGAVADANVVAVQYRDNGVYIYAESANHATAVTFTALAGAIFDANL